MLEELKKELQLTYEDADVDQRLQRYLKEGKHRLDTLNPGRNLETDDTFRSLLKNYVYYAYNHKTYEWEQNYAAIILSWQLESEVPT